jgi:hypothetical protein
MKDNPALEPAPDATPEEDLVELVLQARPPPPPAEAPQRIDGVVIGVLVSFGEGGVPMVDHPQSTSGACLAARSVAALSPEDVGCEVALLFEGGAPDRPIVMGKMHAPAAPVTAGPHAFALGETPRPPPQASAVPVTTGEEQARPGGGAGLAGRLSVSGDGEHLELTAEREIVLRCGQASITLTRAGKVLIRGAYVLTRSSGVNRIQGGSVEIN